MDMKFMYDSESLKIFVDDMKIGNFNFEEMKNLNFLINEKIEMNFYNKNRKVYFSENENIYDNFFRKNFTDKFFDFENVFKLLNNNCISNSNIFSKLKHLSYKLSNKLKEISSVLDKMCELLRRYNLKNKNLFEKISYKSGKEILDLNNKVEKGLNEWKNQFLNKIPLVNEFLGSFSHFKKHENLIFSNLFQKQKKKNLNNVKNFQKMQSFKKKNLSKKNLHNNLSFVNLEKTKEMDTVQRRYNINSYLNKHFIYEFFNYLENSKFYTENNFSSFWKNILELFKSVHIWDDFRYEKYDVYLVDRENALHIKCLF